MASSCSLALSISTKTTSHFIGQNVASTTNNPTCVKFRPLCVSAAAAASCTSTYTSERTTKPHIASTPSSLYEVLGIQAGATCKEIKAAYRRLARVLHPDVVGAAANSSLKKEEENASREFMKVHEAYATLSDPVKRADYDRLFSRQRRQQLKFMTFAMSTSTINGGGGGGGGYRGSWETDQCW